MTEQPQTVLDRDRRVEKADPAGILADALALPEQLRDALWKAESAGLTPVGEPRRASSSPGWAVRGSAGGSRQQRSSATRHARPPVLSAGEYGLPPWTTPGDDRALRQLLRRDRGDAAGLLRGGRA